MLCLAGRTIIVVLLVANTGLSVRLDIDSNNIVLTEVNDSHGKPTAGIPYHVDRVRNARAHRKEVDKFFEESPRGKLQELRVMMYREGMFESIGFDQNAQKEAQFAYVRKFGSLDAAIKSLKPPLENLSMGPGDNQVQVYHNGNPYNIDLPAEGPALPKIEEALGKKYIMVNNFYWHQRGQRDQKVPKDSTAKDILDKQDDFWVLVAE